MKKLLIFPDPLNSICILQSDFGAPIKGKPDTHPSGRMGQSFEIPDAIPNSQGCSLEISAPGKVSLNQRGILFTEDAGSIPACFIVIDDFRLQDKPTESIDNNPNLDPFTIIHDVFQDGKFNLSIKEGCGKFTEAVVKALHEQHSHSWGHIKKIPPQNNYNGHAVDAIMLKDTTTSTWSGIYDIIFNSESPNAGISFNRQGDANLSLWYYPAK